MEITWEGVFWFILVLVVGSFIAGFLDATLEDRKRRREQAEREAYQMKGEGQHEANNAK